MSMRPAMKNRAPCSRGPDPSTKSASTVRSCSLSSMGAQPASTSSTQTTVNRSDGRGRKIRIIAGLPGAQKERTRPLALDRLLEKATAAHRKGAIEAAASLYREVLTLDPRNDVACGNLAVIAATRGDLAWLKNYFAKRRN